MSAEFTPALELQQTQLSVTERLREMTANAADRLGRVMLASTLMAGGGITAFTAGSVVHPSVAYADSIDDALGAYPDKGMPCEHAPYNVTGSCANYDWGPTHTDTDDDPSEISTRQYAYRNCTDWVAYRESVLAGVTVPGSLGLGGQWYDKAPADKRSTNPRAWDAAVEPVSAARPAGHVAFIESVNSVDPLDPLNDNITVSEYNEHFDGTGDQRSGTARSMGFTKFVDFGVHPADSTVTPPPANAPSAKPSVIQSQNGTMQWFARGTSGDVQTNWQSGPGQGWQGSALSLGGNIAGNPVVSMGTNGTIEVFAREINNDVETTWQVAPGSGTWAPWQSLGGNVTGDPVVVRGSSGAFEWFAKGVNGDVQTNWQNGAGQVWQLNAKSLGGSISTPPVAIQGSNGAFELFARGNDGHIDTAWQYENGSDWSGWQSLGGTIADSQQIAIMQSANGAFEWFARGTGGDVQTNWQSGAGQLWQAAALSLGGDISGNVAVNPGTDGAIEVWGRNTNGVIMSTWQTAPGSGTWAEWQSLGGAVSGDPVVVRGQNGAFEWFAIGTNGNLQTNWQSGPGQVWQPNAKSLGGSLSINVPSVLQGTNGAFEAFARGTDGHTDTVWQYGPGQDWSGWQSLGGGLAR